MSKVPSTLEEVQYEVLQGDLAANPKLQPSPIPARDKELKTTAKKIIPAINELVKLIATCKQSVDTYAGEIEEKVGAYGEQLSSALKEEQLHELEIKMESVENSLKEVLSETSETLKQDYALAMEEKMKALETQIQAIVLEQIQEVGTGGSKLKREFISSMDLAPNSGSCVAPFKLQEIQNFNQQVEVLEYSSKYKEYIRIDAQFTEKTTTGSNYEAFTLPVTAKVAEDGTITFVNADCKKVRLYFYRLV